MRKSIVLSTAVLFLGAGCAAMSTTAVAPSVRTGMMASRITEAEHLGAKICAPQALAKAKIALEHVAHEVEEGYYHAYWLEPELAKAEITVEELLAERKAAASRSPQLLCGADGPGEPGLRLGGY